MVNSRSASVIMMNFKKRKPDNVLHLNFDFHGNRKQHRLSTFHGTPETRLTHLEFYLSDGFNVIIKMDPRCWERATRILLFEKLAYTNIDVTRKCMM